MTDKPRTHTSDATPDFESMLVASQLNYSWSGGLTRYLQQLWQTNEEMNLFSRTITPERLWSEHVCDCLAGLPFFPQTTNIIDLGSGGGLPGVILALAFPKSNIWLYEKSPKKNSFLEKVAKEIPNIQVMGPCHGVDWPKEAIVTCRAFKPIRQILLLTQKHLKSGGSYCLYKGRKSRVEEELTECPKSLKFNVEIRPINVPFDAQRHMVLIQG